MWQKYSKLVVPLLALLVGAGAVLVFHPNTSPDSKKQRCPDDYAFINPDIDCAATDQASDQIESARTQVEKIVRDEQSVHHITRASVFFRDLGTRRWFGVNDDVEYYPGSLVKLPLAMGYYKLSELQPTILEEKLTIPKDDTVDGNTDQHYPPEEPLQANTPYSVREMIRHMIVYSDNAAFSPLMDAGKSFVRKSFGDLGIDEIKEGDTVTGWNTSVRTYSGALRTLYNSAYLNTHDSNEILTLLSQSTFTKGIAAGVPGGVKVAHKFGEGTGVTADGKTATYVLNDCGIVYDPNGPFVLCVMTEGQDFSQMEKVIEQIASVSYTAL